MSTATEMLTSGTGVEPADGRTVGSISDSGVDIVAENNAIEPNSLLGTAATGVLVCGMREPR